MFTEKTLFILGAGASWYYGYPLGKGLIDEIMQAIVREQIYVPLTQEQYSKIQYNPNLLSEMKFSLRYVAEQFRNISMKNIPDGGNPFVPVDFSQALNRMNQTGIVPAAYMLAAVKMNQIEEFSVLKEALKQFDPVSIDAFLNNHQSHAFAGKVMIIYALLKCEDPSAFKMGYERRLDFGEISREKPMKEDNWYSYLLGDIMSSCRQPDDIVNNNLDIITFNYDMSLDYVLNKKLSTVEMFSNNSIAKNYIDNLVLNNIHHVYGKLYEESAESIYGLYQEKKSNQGVRTNTARLIQAINSSGLIKLINERLELHKNELYKSLIEKAKKIIIIGFGFDEDNLKVLGFPGNSKGYRIFEGKELLYMDYDGRMRSLAEQFEYLKKRFTFRVVRSSATRVIDAYQNDFKIKLYQDF